MTPAAPEPDGSRSERPLRRSFTPVQKLEHLAAYEAACQTSEGGAYLRSEGLFSSQITEWRKLRDAGVLAGKKPGERVGRPSAEQTEIARLRRDLDRASTGTVCVVPTVIADSLRLTWLNWQVPLATGVVVGAACAAGAPAAISPMVRTAAARAW